MMNRQDSREKSSRWFFGCGLAAIALAANILSASVVGADPAVEGQEWASFANPERGVELFYSKEWHVLETADRYPYLVTIEPQKPDPDLEVMSPTVIEFFKYYHVSQTAQFAGKSADETLKHYVDEVLPSLGQNVEVIATQDMAVQAVPAKLVELKAMDPRGESLLQMLVLAAVKKDVLATIFCQAPQVDFEQNRALCEQVARRAQLFADDDSKPDNAMLDAVTRRLTEEGLDALKTGDGQTMVGKFEQAIRMNPADIDAHMTYGNVLMLLAKDQSGDDRLTLLQRSEHELQMAVYFLQRTESSEETRSKTAEAYFVMGQIAYYGREDPILAKPLYEEALKSSAHAGATDALKRYTGN